MPIYEYACDACGHEFELLVRGSQVPACAQCGSEALNKKLSLPRVHSESTRAKSRTAARKRDQKLGSERMHERVEYESSHDD
jgi:putative FmdB family regulatory protein